MRLESIPSIKNRTLLLFVSIICGFPEKAPAALEIVKIEMLNSWLYFGSEKDLSSRLALLHKSCEVRSSPFPQTRLAYRFCDRYTKSSVAIEDGDADLDFYDLPLEIPRHQRLAE